MRPILALRLGDLFPIPTTDIAFDYLLTEDVNEGGRLVIVCGTPADTLRKAQAALRDAGIEPVRAVPVAFGSATLVAQGSGAVIEEAVEGYGIDIVESGSVRYSRVVPLNANVAAEACRTSTAAGLPCGDLIAAGGAVFPESDRSVAESSLASLLRHVPQLDLRLAEEVAKEKAGQQSRSVRQAALLLLASVAIAVYTYNDYDVAAGKADAAVAQQTKFVRDAEKTEKAATATAAELTRLQETLNKAFSPAQSPADIVASASALAPQGLWLGGVAIERGKAIQIRGTATRSAAVSEFVNALEASPRFRNAKLQFANDAEVAEKPVIQFSIEAFPVGNLPILESANSRTAVKK
ncbi:hypothetical protein EON81_28140 [bacterium]|nr:MAG: hypothetical protein EON81_28140 [bacterium]